MGCGAGSGAVKEPGPGGEGKEGALQRPETQWSPGLSDPGLPFSRTTVSQSVLSLGFLSL